MKLKKLLELLKADLIRLLAEVENPSYFDICKKSFNPRFFPVLMIRLSRYFYLNRWLKFLSPVFTWLNIILFGIEFTPRCEVGCGLLLPHSVGTVIGASKIGNNATIFQGVTLGAISLDLGFDPSLRPQIGDNVVVGAGAKILGGLVVGDNVKVGANAVVLYSLDSNATAVGIPARLIEKKTSK